MRGTPMTTMSRARAGLIVGALAALLAVAAPRPAAAHCDTMDGPVVRDGHAALAAGDITPVLKWVRPADEAELRATFATAVRVRAAGGDARELADRLFLETVVRLHRQGEGAPFTGLKPAGEVEPGIALADHALAEGSAAALVAAVTREVGEAVKARFERVVAAKAHAVESVAAGREFVAAYVEYVHAVEGILAAAARGGHGTAEPGGGSAAHQHE